MIRFAIIGTNIISDKFIYAASIYKDVEIYAIYSRTYERGKYFADKHNIKNVITDINLLANDNNIDAVYIASPNAIHYEQALIMLSNKKHVLCEKTITSNSRELKNIIEIANKNKVVILEAMRSIFDTGFLNIKNNLYKLGKIRNVFFEYCQYSSRYDNYKKGIIENAFKVELSNGALMDIGVYCIHTLANLFGMPKEIKSNSIKLETGVDGAGTIITKYDDMTAILNYSKITNGFSQSHIQGENATMLIPKIAEPYEIKICYRNGEVKTIKREHCENNMIYEIKEFINLINNNIYDNEYIKKSEIVLNIIDEVKKQNNIVFSADK